LATLDRASKRVAVEVKHPVKINDTQDNMINLTDGHH